MTDDKPTAPAPPDGAPTPPEHDPAMTETDDVVFETLWGRVVEAWDDDKTHNAALDYALRAQRLPELAGRYRALKDDPDKGPRAKKRIDAIVLAATQLMLATKSPGPQKAPPGLTVSAFAIALFLIALLAWAFFGRHAR